MKALSPLLQAIKLSDQILLAIQDEQWNMVSELDQQRVGLIQSCFDGKDPPDKALTLKLKQLNDDIVARLQKAQQHVRVQQVGMKNVQNATKAYQANQPGYLSQKSTVLKG